MIWPILQVVVIQIILPALFIFELWRARSENKLDWTIQLLFTTTFITWLFFSGSWDWVGYYVKYIWPVLLIPAVYFSWKKTSNLPFRTQLTKGQKFSRGIYIVLLLIFGMYNVSILTGYYSTSDDALNLTFPLQDGTYTVRHGGSSTQLNYHNAYEPQQFAIDIVALNSLGFRANGLYPAELDRYIIYGNTLTAPCTGEVVETRDGLPDLKPSERNPDQPEGNYVGLTCNGSEAVLYMAHMMEGSVSVEEGESIQEGQTIGKVGNSGNTSEPHLHMHAEKNGVGIPLEFNGNFLTRNEIIQTN